MGISGGAISQPGTSVQREQTAYHEEFTDNHGRRFAAQFDIRNQRPKEELRPVGFLPPWLPPMRYIQWQRAGSFHFRWDYHTIASEFSAHVGDYYREATKFALEHNLPEPDMMGGLVDRRIRSVYGDPPLSPAIPLACQMGDPWALGEPGAEDKLGLKAVLEQHTGSSGMEVLATIRAALAAKGEDVSFLPERKDESKVPAAKVKTINDIDYDPSSVTYQEFSKMGFAKGMPQVEIVQAWKEHKALLAEV